MQQLIEGYRAFRQERWPAERQRYLDLATNGQKPQTLVITCSDSRSDPATIFNASPGSMFVIRNVAAIVPPYETDETHHGTSAAIAFAVLSHAVRPLLVLGQAHCGGVSAALDNSIADGVPFLRAWVDLLDPAVQKLPHGTHDRHTLLEQEAVRLSLAQLMTFPFVAERVNAGRLELNGARFGIADGKLELLNRASGEFAVL